MMAQGRVGCRVIKKSSREGKVLFGGISAPKKAVGKTVEQAEGWWQHSAMTKTR